MASLLVLDVRGRKLMRLRLPARLALTWWVGVSIAASILLTLVIRGTTLSSAAARAHVLQRENAALRELLATTARSVHIARPQIDQARTAFDHLRRKSGIGWPTEPAGIGPLAEATSPAVSFADYGPALPDRITGAGQHAVAMQRGLAELIEYFHDAERMLSNTPSTNPTQTRSQTSGYGKRRDPMNNEWRVHKGVDLSGQIGQPIHAPADGIAIFTGLRGGYGNTLVLDHGYGLQTHFAHLSGFKTKVGQRVRRGDVIALMGNTGKSTGPHLHYEVRRFGEPLNPQHFILD